MADNKKYIQSQVFKLAGGGISLSDTSISLQSFKFPPATGSAPITMAHLGSICTATIEPGAAKEEIISFTGVTQNGDGSATLTGVTRGLKFGDTAGDYGQDLSLRKSHGGSTSLIITNNPQFYDGFANKNNDETILGDWQFPAPANPNSAATKQYVIDALGGAVGTASNTTFGTVKTTKNQGSKPKVVSALVREQASPDKTLVVESFRQTFIDKIITYAGDNTPNFIDPAMGGDLAFALNPANGETITITVDGTACVFTAVSSIGASAGNFLIGGSAAATRANFAALLNNPTVTNANQVAFSGAQLTAIQKLSCTDDLALNVFVRVINTSTTSFTITETMAGAGNIWTVNSTKNRYDLIVIDDAGALQIRKGLEAVSPVVPTPTSGDLTLALVFNKVGQIVVKDINDATNGYIAELYNPSVYRTDLLTSSVPLTPSWGDGSDGDVTISVNTNLTRDMYYNNLTINNGIVLSPKGFRIFVKNTLTFVGTGLICSNGGAGSAGTGNVTGNSVPPGGSGGTQDYTAGSLPAPLAGVAGGNGGQAATGTAGVGGTAGTSAAKSIGAIGAAGGSGSTGGTAGSGAGPGAGGASGAAGTQTGTVFNKLNSLQSAYCLFDTQPSIASFTLSAGSGGGGGGGGGRSVSGADCGCGGGGGGSGSSGGFVWVSAFNVVTVNGNNYIEARGGNGGNGGNGGPSTGNNGGGGSGGGGGAGGSGGVFVFLYHTKTGTGTIDVSGGTGGTGGALGTKNGTGTNGTAGTDGSAGVSGVNYSFVI